VFATLSPIPGFRTWLIATNPRWNDFDASHATETERRELSTLCARYLLAEKRNREPLDAVARFHLANGARLERVNWRGDTSVSGLQRSFGFTANYVYRLEEVERNHEAYAAQYRVIASRGIERLAGR
jgi:malonyl-CoA decarboxylase